MKTIKQSNKETISFNGTTATMGYTVSDGKAYVWFCSSRGVKLYKSMTTGGECRRLLQQKPLQIKLQWLVKMGFKGLEK